MTDKVDKSSLKENSVPEFYYLIKKKKTFPISSILELQGAIPVYVVFLTIKKGSVDDDLFIHRTRKNFRFIPSKNSPFEKSSFWSELPQVTPGIQYSAENSLHILRAMKLINCRDLGFFALWIYKNSRWLFVKDSFKILIHRWQRYLSPVITDIFLNIWTLLPFVLPFLIFRSLLT